MLENMILGIISCQDATGYDIKKVIETKLCLFYKSSFGSLYPALKRLLEKGYVTTYEQAQGARQKIFYRITEAGRDSFMEWLAVPMEISDGGSKNLVKIYFYDLLSADIRNMLLLRYEQDNMQYLKQLEKLESELSSKVDQEKDYYKFSTLYYGIVITKQTIEWCKHIRQGGALQELLLEM